MDITNTLAKLRIEELNAMQEAALAAILHTCLLYTSDAADE